MARKQSRRTCKDCGHRPAAADREQPHWTQMGICGGCWDRLTRVRVGHRNQDPRYIERTWQDVLDRG